MRAIDGTIRHLGCLEPTHLALTPRLARASHPPRNTSPPQIKRAADEAEAAREEAERVAAEERELSLDTAAVPASGPRLLTLELAAAAEARVVDPGRAFFKAPFRLNLVMSQRVFFHADSKLHYAELVVMSTSLMMAFSMTFVTVAYKWWQELKRNQKLLNSRSRQISFSREILPLFRAKTPFSWCFQT